MAKGSEVEVGAQNGATQRNDATMQRCNDATTTRPSEGEGEGKGMLTSAAGGHFVCLS